MVDLLEFLGAVILSVVVVVLAIIAAIAIAGLSLLVVLSPVWLILAIAHLLT